MNRQSDHANTFQANGRPCLHCGKLFSVAAGDRRTKVDNFCSTSCDRRFRGQFDLWFVQGCRRPNHARGLCRVHSQSNAADAVRRGSASIRLRNYGLARQSTFLGNTMTDPDAGAKPILAKPPLLSANGASGFWRRIVQRYGLFDSGTALDGREKSEPLSSGKSVEFEIDQARFIRSPLI